MENCIFKHLLKFHQASNHLFTLPFYHSFFTPSFPRPSPSGGLSPLVRPPHSPHSEAHSDFVLLQLLASAILLASSTEEPSEAKDLRLR